MGDLRQERGNGIPQVMKGDPRIIATHRPGPDQSTDQSLWPRTAVFYTPFIVTLFFKVQMWHKYA